MGKYIDKIEFHKLLKEYRDNSLIIEESTDAEDIRIAQYSKDHVYEKIGKRFLLIAKNYINKPSYINYTPDWKDDMISEAVYDMVRYIDNYDVDLMEDKLEAGGTPDPFAYFSRYVYNGIMRFLGEKRKDKDVLVRLPFIENIEKREVSND